MKEHGQIFYKLNPLHFFSTCGIKELLICCTPASSFKSLTNNFRFSVKLTVEETRPYVAAKTVSLHQFRQSLLQNQPGFVKVFPWNGCPR